MKLHTKKLLLPLAALALFTGLAVPVQAAPVEPDRGTSLTVSIAEDDAANVQQSLVADLHKAGITHFTAELYQVASYAEDGNLTGEPAFVALDFEHVVEQALAAYEAQPAASPTPDPGAAPDTGKIPGSVWQTVWEEKAAQANTLVEQNRLKPTASVQLEYEPCTDTTARYRGTVQDLACGLYLVRLPRLNGTAYYYTAQPYLVSVPYNASQDQSVPQTQPDVWEYEVTTYPKWERQGYPTPTPPPGPDSRRPGALTRAENPAAKLLRTVTGRLPQTGDTSQPLLWLVLMLAAAAGFALVLVKKHKHNGGNRK